MRVAVWLVLCSCSLAESGLLRDSGSDTAFDVTILPEASAVDAVADVAPEAATCNPDSCQGERCIGNACDFYATCKTMHAADPTRKTGAHWFHTTASYTAFCDMDTQGGGWTLVGRTSPVTGSATFGWHQDSMTDPTDMSKPYSLDPMDKNMPFTEALAGTMGQSLTWGMDIYQLALPSGFPSSFMTSAGSAAVTTITSYSNFCMTMPPTMLSNVGYVNETNNFFFRDNTGEGGGAWGFQPQGWSTAYSDCRGGLIDASAGMLMVR
jgi:hypothetical protein